MQFYADSLSWRRTEPSPDRDPDDHTQRYSLLGLIEVIAVAPAYPSCQVFVLCQLCKGKYWHITQQMKRKGTESLHRDAADHSTACAAIMDSCSQKSVIWKSCCGSQPQPMDPPGDAGPTEANLSIAPTCMLMAYGGLETETVCISDAERHRTHHL
jgi:hypothetical protein